MTSVAEFRPSSNLAAALLLVAQDLLRAHSLAYPTVKEICAALGAGKSRAYELAHRVRTTLMSLEPAPGRPPKPKSLPATDPCAELSRKLLGYLIEHPGAIYQEGTRQVYSDDARAFVVELCAQYPDLESDAIAKAISIPASTLREWLRACPYPSPSDATKATTPLAEALETSHDLHVKTVISAWRTFRGRFTAFCRYLKVHHEIPFGRAAIASILEAAGVRIPERRRGRSPDEKALRDTFETFFPGAQWTGDGTPLQVELEGQSFAFNLELVVDTYSGAAVGIDVRDEEDADAVVAAFEDGKQTTGEPPQALLLDNRPSNHTPKIEEALNETILIRSTLGRAQNKAHVEGAFGLFSKTVPSLVIDGETPHERARQVLELVARTWARTLNHRPRQKFQGQTRFNIYHEYEPTPEEISRAKAELEERARRQKLAFETLRARQDPIVRPWLDETFERLELDDPQGNIRSAIARYPWARILEGVAIYEAKRRAGTLPQGVDARYLLGIIRNRSHDHEGMAIAERLWALRLEARDRVFDSLWAKHDACMKTLDEPKDRLRRCIDEAMSTNAGIERFYWLDRAVEIIRRQPKEQHKVLFGVATKRIISAYRVGYKKRCNAILSLASALVPLD